MTYNDLIDKFEDAFPFDEEYFEKYGKKER